MHKLISISAWNYDPQRRLGVFGAFGKPLRGAEGNREMDDPVGANAV